MEEQSRSSIREHNLPAQFTPFVGRAHEIAEITRLLADPSCRMLTLIGPGGIGKTRLAIQAAVEMLDTHMSTSKDGIIADGVFFVPLQPIQSADYLVSALSDAVNLSLLGQEDPVVQLLNYLHVKHMLLILDNFEHLLAPSGLGRRPISHSSASIAKTVEIEAAADLLSDIVTAAPGAKLLITSREILNLQEEWLYHVQGLSFPNTVHGSASNGNQDWEELEAYSAVQLFAERARRLRHNFSLADEGQHVVRICQLVGGMPLAIELAASWTKTLPGAVIASEIERNIDFLTTNLRNVPDRQRSIRAVFDQSWQFLSEQEQGAFKRLSVFHGSFGREAAEQVAGASLSTLLSLVDKSLLHPEPEGRYQIHELLRQYGAVQLAQSPEDVGYVYDLHCAYYADFLHRQWEDLSGTRQREATMEIKAELDNIRAAWGWAVGMTKVKELQKASSSLSWFYQYQSRYLEGDNAFEQAANSLMREESKMETDQVLAVILVDLAWFYIRLGRLGQAEAMANQSRDIYRRLGALPAPGHATDPLLPLGIIASIRGDYTAAAEFGEEARRESDLHDHEGNLPFALYVLARASLAEGDFETARRHAQRACAIVERTNDRWFMAYCLNELGNVASALGNYAEAEQHYQTSYAIRQEFDDPEGMALALNHLGRIAILQENHEQAKQLYQQSLAIYQGIKDRGGLATSLNGLATSTCALGDYQSACRYFRQALHIAADIRYLPLILSILTGIGESMLKTGREERGIELLAFVQGHPAADPETRTRAQSCLTHYQSTLPPDVVAWVTQRGHSIDLETVTAALATELDTMEIALATRPPTTGQGTGLPDQSLVEPLTTRELEVLQLIADGLTNQQIAEELILSVGTVKFYSGQIYGKLNVHSRTQAVARARELEMLA